MPESVRLSLWRCVKCAVLFAFFESEYDHEDTCPVCHDRITFVGRVRAELAE